MYQVDCQRNLVLVDNTAILLSALGIKTTPIMMI